MNNWISLTVKNVRNGTMHISDRYFEWICHKHKSLPLGPIPPSSPSTYELHAFNVMKAATVAVVMAEPADLTFGPLQIVAEF